MRVVSGFNVLDIHYIKKAVKKLYSTTNIFTDSVFLFCTTIGNENL